MKMSSDLLSALDAEESGDGKGFVTSITYGNEDVKSNKEVDEEEDDDEIIIVDKEKAYSLRQTGPVRAKPPLSRQHKDAMEFSSKELGRIPKISSPKSSLTLQPKAGPAKTFQPYPLKSASGTSQKRTHCVIQNRLGNPTAIIQPEIKLIATPNNQQIIIASAGSTNLVPGTLQITPTGGYIIRQITESTNAVIDNLDVSQGTSPSNMHSIASLPTQMTPTPVNKLKKLQVLCTPIKLPVSSPTPVKVKKLQVLYTPIKSPASSSTEDSLSENVDDDKTETRLCAVCSKCGVRSKSLVKCDHCQCDFASKKYRKLITVAKEDENASKNNVQHLRSGRFVIQNFYSNKGKCLLPVRPQLPPSTAGSSNWKEPIKRKTYSQRKPKKFVEPVCISISSDEEEPMSQDEEVVNGSVDRNSPVFHRTSHHLPKNGQLESNSVFSELKRNSHHRTDDIDSGSGYNTTPPKKVTRKQRMRNQDEQLMVSEASSSNRNASLKDDDLSDCSLDNMDITVDEGLRCVTVDATLVRIGSLEYKSPTPVEFQWNRVVLHISTSQQLELKTSELVSCAFFISSSLFSIFFKTVPAVGIRIRDRLKLNGGIRYDPGSCDQSKKTINIHANQLTENETFRLRKLIASYGAMNKDLKCSEVERSKIDFIIEKCKPTPVAKECAAYNWDDSMPSSTSQHVTRPSSVQPSTLQLVYPPNASKGRISVTSEDVGCLEEGEFINDVIIDFYLKYLLHEVLSEEVRERTHIFSTFFYKRLSKRVANLSKSDQAPHRSVAERRHSHVKSWTRNVDLFKKDFIIIPVNESAHWYVAIVCFAGLPTMRQKNTTPHTGDSDSQDSCGSSELTSNNTENNVTDNSTENNVTDNPTENNVTDNSTENNATDNSTENNVTDNSTENNVTDNSTENNVTDNSTENNVTDNSTENNVTDNSTENNVTDNSTENNVTDNPTNVSPGKPVHQEELEDIGESDNIPDGEKMDKIELRDECTRDNNQQLTDNSLGDLKRDRVGIAEHIGLTCHYNNIHEAIRHNKELDYANDVFHIHQNFTFKQPCILIFDSLKGTKRNTCINKLKDYISVEWSIRKGKQREFEFKGIHPEVPQQSNYHDCGVYVLQYVESFFTMPIKNFSAPLKGLSEWFNEERVNCKRDDIKLLISNLKELYKDKR